METHFKPSLRLEFSATANSTSHGGSGGNFDLNSHVFPRWDWTTSDTIHYERQHLVHLDKWVHVILHWDGLIHLPDYLQDQKQPTTVCPRENSIYSALQANGRSHPRSVTIYLECSFMINWRILCYITYYSNIHMNAYAWQQNTCVCV